MLLPVITLVVHEVDTAAHPSVPPGWRWAVQVGGGRVDDISRCAQAGWAADEAEAWRQGEVVALAAVQAVRTFGVPAGYQQLRLRHDPIPVGHDRLRILSDRPT